MKQSALKMGEEAGRVALISDIHGNLVALGAVLAAIRHADVDRIICLGDVATLGPQPRRVLAKLIALNCPVVMGNTDAWLLDPVTPTLSPSLPSEAIDINLWCQAQLSVDDLRFIGRFPGALRATVGPVLEILCAHGSPRSNTEAILSTTPEEMLNEMLSGGQGSVIACGHTHVQMLRCHEEVTLVNPGSVGRCVETINSVSPRAPVGAEFAIVEWTHGALVAVEHRRVPLDLNSISRSAHDSGMPHAEWWIDAWDVARHRHPDQSLGDTDGPAS